MNREIPIFFSTDDNYIPYLDVAIHSLIENASKNFWYRIIVLNILIPQLDSWMPAISTIQHISRRDIWCSFCWKKAVDLFAMR